MLSFRKLAVVTVLSGIFSSGPAVRADEPLQEAEMAGYLLVPHDRVPDSYNAGFSMYVAAWPLLNQYPGSRFQTGLFGTWMFAQHDKPKPKDLYSDIEGGLGWWRDTRFATVTPKFIMGGVALNFSEWANGPGAGKGRDWANPTGLYGVAQLSPWVVWPPDGLNLKQGTCGEFVGYGYLPLPLSAPKTSTAGQPVPTGNQCWTLFLNTQNFKGPLTCFTPYFWSKATVKEPKLAGLFLDSRPSDPNKAVQMETQYVPAVLAADSKGEAYARIAPTSFPRNAAGESVLIHRITAYDKSALWNAVQTWFEGGPPATGQIDPRGSILHTFRSEGGSTWQIYALGSRNEQKVPVAWNAFATPIALDEHTYGYRWNEDHVTRTETATGHQVTLPEFYRRVNKGGKPAWVAVPRKEIPPETGLLKYQFERESVAAPEPYVTPDDAASSWKKPGPAAGPFETQLGDGSVVTYYWYRFADQPALQNADLTDAERERMQKRVEKLHASWKKDQEYLPPPAVGTLAELDPALLVTPPKGLEVGYVPIATRQAARP